jgi:hypothetical protein
MKLLRQRTQRLVWDCDFTKRKRMENMKEKMDVERIVMEKEEGDYNG